MTSDDKDMVNHPSHYTWHPTGVECIDINEWFCANLAAALKYIWRVDEKGDHINNMEKAVFYINREITRRKSVEYNAGKDSHNHTADTGSEAWDAIVGLIGLWENHASSHGSGKEALDKFRPGWTQFIRERNGRRHSNS